MPPPQFKLHVLPILQELIVDPIPNVRFNVCKCIKELKMSIINAELVGEVQGLLKSVVEDQDEDVKYYGLQAQSAF